MITPVRQKLLNFVSPTVADFVVTELQPITRLVIPEYGSAHPDSVKYPSHKFVKAYVADEEGTLYTFLYAAEREYQDLYNFESGRFNVGGVEFFTVTRTYIHLRESFDPDSPAINEAMPNLPVDMFEAEDYLLFDKQQIRTDDERLDSLFIIEKRVYLRHTGTQEKSIGQDNLTPVKFRRLATLKDSSTLEDLTEATIPDGDLVPDPESPVGDETLRVNTKLSDDQFIQRIVKETLAEGDPLAGHRLTDYGNTSNTSESLIYEGTSAPSLTYLSIGYSDDPLGNGKSVRSTETVASFPLMNGTEIDETLNVAVAYTRQIVPAGTTSSNPLIEITPIDGLRSWQKTYTAPISALNSYLNSTPCKVELPDLPRELVSVDVIWNSSFSIGNQNYGFAGFQNGDSGSFSKSVSDSASSAASIIPEIQFKYRDIATSGLYGIKKVFFLPNPVTSAAILAKVSAVKWPVFRPESSTITTSGQSVSVQSNVQISLEGTWDADGVQSQAVDNGSSDDFRVNLSVGSVQIPACIHNNIVITNSAPHPIFVAATAYMNMNHSVLGSTSATCTKAGTATGSVSPQFLAATTGRKTIPTSGTFMIDAPSIQDYRWGYSKITAVVFNAANLAP